jgi:UDP-4-amino-4,6-dideoxy-N-acetyl-beta-L-altrosamine transaminase
MRILFLGNETNILYNELKKYENIDIISKKIDKKDVINYDFIISFGYRYIIKKDIIELFKNNNIINLHISYLPYNRGADPNLWSILDNTPSGVTIHLIDENIDTGDILIQERVFFDYDNDTLESSYNKLINKITLLFLDNWELIKNNKITPIPQDSLKKTIHCLKDRPEYDLILINDFQTKLSDIKSNYNKFYRKNIPNINNSIPYGKQTIEQNDIDAVLKVFEENEMLTTGKYVPEFENKVCQYIGVKYAVAVNSGTAALHLATYAIDIKEEDEVIVPAISFVASANCVLYQRGKPVFCDIDPDTMCIDIQKIESLITKNTKAVLFVDMCGQPANFDEIKAIADKYSLLTIHDAAHSIGSLYKNRKVGSYADITCFSFHPVKNITTCEGGMMVTNNEEYYKRAFAFRTHGISRDFKEREKMNSHYYEMQCLGFNYRIPDVLCALGIEQLKRLDKFVERRNEIANKYNELFKKNNDLLVPLTNNYYSAYHIYVIKLNLENINKDRDTIFKELKNSGIGVNVHYMPIYLHPYYQSLGYKTGLCPIAEDMYKRIITLPIFPMLKDEEVEYIYNKIINLIKTY